MNRDVSLKVKFFLALAHPVRLRILEELRGGELCVSELVRLIEGVSQSQVSNHLACLRECGLVTFRREWRRMYYSISNPKVVDLLRTAEDILTEISERIEACPDIERRVREDARRR